MQYIDGWMPHYRASKFECAPISVGAQGERIGIYDCRKCGISRMYTVSGELRKRFVVKTRLKSGGDQISRRAFRQMAGGLDKKKRRRG